MVHGARVQRVVKGDDVSLTHQVVDKKALIANVTLAPISVNEADTIKFFYPLEDPTQNDLTGYPGAPVGAYPTDTFTVAVAGSIVAPPAADRGTKTWQSGEGRTVRVEITRESGAKETHYLIDEVDVLERGFPSSLDDTSGGLNPPSEPLNLT